MKSKNALALFTAAALVSLPIFAANPAPAPPAPPPAPAAPPATKTNIVSTTVTICYQDAKALTACAESWQAVADAGNKVDNTKNAWEASGFENYVAGIRFVNEDMSWCNPSGTETTYEDAFKIVAKYLADHPDKMDSEPASLVNFALKAAYPCGKKGH